MNLNEKGAIPPYRTNNHFHIRTLVPILRHSFEANATTRLRPQPRSGEMSGLSPILYALVGCFTAVMLVMLVGAALQYARLITFGGQDQDCEAQFLSEMNREKD